MLQQGTDGYQDTLECLVDLAKESSSAGQAPQLISFIAQVRHEGTLEEGLCHQVVHELGKFEMQRLSHDVGAMIAEVPALPCTSGVLHGALIAWGMENPSRDEQADMAELCRSLKSGLPNPDPAVPYSSFETMGGDCADGFGHAAWHASGENAFRAIEQCSMLADDELIRLCILGVGMEGAEGSPENPNPTLTATTAMTELAPWCADQEYEVRRDGCGAMLAIPFGAELEALIGQDTLPTAAEINRNATTAIERCTQLPVDSMVNSCLHELVGRALGTFSGDAAWLCPLLPAEQTRQCQRRVEEHNRA